MSEQAKGKSRFDFLSRFLSKQDAQDFEKAVSTQEAILDGKVERKAFDEDKAKGILEKLQDSFRKPLSQLTDDVDLQTKLATEFIALAMGALQDVGSEEVIEEELPLEEFAADDEEEEETPEELMQLGKSVVDLAVESVAVHKEFKELIPIFVSIAEGAKSKQIEKSDFEDRIKKLETLVALTPRSASQSDGTVVESDALKAIIEKGVLGETKTIWGHATKPEVN